MLFVEVTPKMSVKNNIVNCDLLDSRSNLAAYIGAIRNVTNGNLTVAMDCRSAICNALWGSGNPDVDGIGVCSKSLQLHGIPADIVVDDHWLLLRKRE